MKFTCVHLRGKRTDENISLTYDFTQPCDCPQTGHFFILSETLSPTCLVQSNGWGMGNKKMSFNNSVFKLENDMLPTSEKTHFNFMKNV
jgi:hypothetical protein